jgi:4-hydroxythreonine-4-phosphate dehydrogenase
MIKQKMMTKQSERKNVPIIGITCGDLNGIGPEVIFRMFQDNRLFQTGTPVLFGPGKSLQHYKKQYFQGEPGLQEIKEISEVVTKNLCYISTSEEDFKPNAGIEDRASGVLAEEALKMAVRHLKSGMVDAIVTAPIQKHSIHSASFPFPGHTEYLAHEAGVKDYLMLLIGESIRAGTVTGHLPLSEVSGKLNQELIITKAKIFLQSLKIDFGIRKPKLAILGLNPHAGDGGLLGKEEDNIILPAIHKLRDEGHVVAGPYSADGYFGSGAAFQFDGVLGMYHDQVLAPFKALEFNNGINFTAGLPFVRTSPDHGTAYDIAGKNKASEGSMRAAFYMAVDIVQQRRQMQEISANPLKVSPGKKERDYSR